MSISVPLYGFGASGGTGGTLTVTTPGAGITVTVSKDGKSKVKISSADGTAVFRGLESGEWTVTMTDGSQTATKTATVTTAYSVALTFFAAAIGVTYPEGSVCTATDGVTTLTAPDTSGAWDCTVPNAGTWTVACTDGEKADSQTVEITADGQAEAVELAFWHGELYINGDPFTDVTGGWKACPANDSNYVKFNSTNIQFVNNSSTYGSAAVYTVNKVDVTNFSTLVVTVSSGSGCRFGITNTPMTKSTGDSTGTYVSSAGTSGTGRLDLSGVTGSYYIMLSTLYNNFTVTEVYMQ